jgi:hypothetical protein
MKRLGICMLALLPIFSFLAGTVRADLSISPAHVELDLDKGVPSGVFLITNLGDAEARYRINAVAFAVNQGGGIELVVPDDRSMASWIVFNPKEFTIAPNARRRIRFAVAPRGKLRTGEYWAAMELESLDPAIAKGKDDKGSEITIRVIPSIIVPIFGKVGKVRYRGMSKEIKVVSSEGKGKTIEAWVANTGEGRLLLKGKYDIVNESGKVIESGDLGRSYIMPGGNLKFSVALKTEMETGTYTVKVRYDSQQLEKPILGEIQFMAKSASLV